METISLGTAVLPRLPLLCVFLSPLSICMLAPVGLAYVQHYGRMWKLRRGLWLVGLALCWIGCIVSGCIWIWQRKPEALMVSLQLPLVNALLIEIYFGVHLCAAFNYEKRLWNYQNWYPFATGAVAIVFQSSGHYAESFRPLAVVGTPLWHGALTGFLCMKSLVYPIPSDDRLRKNLQLWTGCFAVATFMSISLALVFSLVRDAQDKYYIYCLVQSIIEWILLSSMFWGGRLLHQDERAISLTSFADQNSSAKEGIVDDDSSHPSV